MNARILVGIVSASAIRTIHTKAIIICIIRAHEQRALRWRRRVICWGLLLDGPANTLIIHRRRSQYVHNAGTR